MKVIKILLVEDDHLSADLVQNTLKPIVDRFPDGEILLAGTMAAAEEIASNVPHPDIVILDLSLPDSTREETLSTIPRFLDRSPVLVITGWPDPDLHEAVLKTGAGLLKKIDLNKRSLFKTIIATILSWKGDTPRMKAIRENLREAYEILDNASPQR